MNRIIKGKRYNTETAQRVFVSESPEPSGSEYWERETLYRKRSGEFFLVTERAEASPQPTDELRPLRPDEAEAWAEAYMPAAETEALFGGVPADSSRGTLCITLPKNTISILRLAAQMEQMTLSAYIESIINRRFEEVEK